MKQQDLFSNCPNDLPLFSGTPQAAHEERFTPKPLDPGQQVFEGWMKDVNATCVGTLGMDVLDLPDMAFRDWFEAHYTPKEAIEAILENLDDDYPGIFDAMDDEL